MATKATLESALAAVKAQNEQLMAQIQALSKQAPKRAEKPLVERGFFKTQDPSGKWVDDTSRPCIIVNVPGAKPHKMAELTFERTFIELYEDIVLAYEKLPKNSK